MIKICVYVSFYVMYVPNYVSVKRQVVVVELSEIEKEYILIHARLELLKRDPEPSRTSG